MRSLVLGLVAVAGLALTAGTADAQYRYGGYRGGGYYVRPAPGPYYGGGFYNRPYSGGYARPYYGGYNRPYYGGYGYRPGFSITVGNGGFYPGYGGGFYRPGFGFRGW